MAVPPCPIRAQILLSSMHLMHLPVCKLHQRPATVVSCVVIYLVSVLSVLIFSSRLGLQVLGDIHVVNSHCVLLAVHNTSTCGLILGASAFMLRRKAGQVQYVHPGQLMCPNMTWAIFRDPGQKSLLFQISQQAGNTMTAILGT